MQFLRGLELEMRSFVQKEALVQWQQLRALQILWAEIAEECDGEDLRQAALRDQTEDLRARILMLLTAVSPKLARHPPEASDAVMSTIRAYVDDAMRMFGFREPL